MKTYQILLVCSLFTFFCIQASEDPGLQMTQEFPGKEYVCLKRAIFDKIQSSRHVELDDANQVVLTLTGWLSYLYNYNDQIKIKADPFNEKNIQVYDPDFLGTTLSRLTDNMDQLYKEAQNKEVQKNGAYKFFCRGINAFAAIVERSLPFYLPRKEIYTLLLKEGLLENHLKKKSKSFLIKTVCCDTEKQQDNLDSLTEAIWLRVMRKATRNIVPKYTLCEKCDFRQDCELFLALDEQKTCLALKQEIEDFRKMQKICEKSLSLELVHAQDMPQQFPVPNQIDVVDNDKQVLCGGTACSIQ